MKLRLGLNKVEVNQSIEGGTSLGSSSSRAGLGQDEEWAQSITRWLHGHGAQNQWSKTHFNKPFTPWNHDRSWKQSSVERETGLMFRVNDPSSALGKVDYAHSACLSTHPDCASEYLQRFPILIPGFQHLPFFHHHKCPLFVYCNVSEGDHVNLVDRCNQLVWDKGILNCPLTN